MTAVTIKQQQLLHHGMFYKIITLHSVWIGFIIRLFIAWFLPWMMDQNPLLGVDYTDIDFYVFSDAAQYIQNENGSPYHRATYRYTPFLAYILSKLPHREYGRILFCIADTICGYIIILYRRTNRKRLNGTEDNTGNDATVDAATDSNNNNNDSTYVALEDAMWWLYNPFAINICTRGSAESLVVLLPVLLTVWITTAIKQPSITRNVTTTVTTTTTTNNKNYQLYGAAILAGSFHGIAIHAKLYPIIYTLSFMTQFVNVTRQNDNNNNNKIKNRSILYASYHIIFLWIRRLVFCPASILFGLSTVMTFGIITYLAVRWYGNDAINEGLLYHFSRVDHRHNYSMHWYWIYLLRDRIASSSSSSSLLLSSTTSTIVAEGTNSTVNSIFNIFNIHPETLTKMIGIVLLIPQMILLLYSSIGIAPYSLSLALFVQTFLFVAHNKVITAQYFTWYLCLLPLCSDQFRLTKRVIYALLFLGLSIIFWLSSAYCLEMQGMAVHQVVWMASLLFFVANVNLMGALLSTTAELQRKSGMSHAKVKVT